MMLSSPPYLPVPMANPTSLCVLSVRQEDDIRQITSVISLYKEVEIMGKKSLISHFKSLDKKVC